MYYLWKDINVFWADFVQGNEDNSSTNQVSPANVPFKPSTEMMYKTWSRNHWCKAKLTTENQSKNFPRLSLYMLPIKKLSILLHDVLCNIWTSLCKNMHLFLLIKNANDYNVHVCPVIIWVWTKLVPRPNTKNIVELQTPDYIRSNNNEGVHWWSGIQWF